MFFRGAEGVVETSGKGIADGVALDIADDLPLDGPPGLTLTPSSDGVITIELTDGVTDYAAIINAALREPGVTEVRLGEGTFTVSVPISLPSGAHLTGAGRDATTIKANDDFYGRAGTSGVVETEARATNITLADFFIDANKVLPTGLRVNGLFLNMVEGFDVTRVDVANATGYAHFAAGDVREFNFGNPDARPTSGSYTDIRTFNSQVHFEVMFGDGVTYTNVHARDGDGDIPTEAYFHPLLGSKNISYIDSSAEGKGFIGFSVISSGRPLENISIINTHVEISIPNTGYGFLDHSGLPTINLRIENSSFISHDYIGFSGYRLDGSAVNSLFQGRIIGMAVDNDDDDTPYVFTVTDSQALAVIDPNNKFGLAGLDATAGLIWIGGEIEARGSGGLMLPAAGSGEISEETILVSDGYLTRAGFSGVGSDTLLFPTLPLPDANFGSFAGGAIEVDFRAYHAPADVLRIVSGIVAGVQVVGDQVSFNGVVVATISGGTAGEKLAVSLNAAATEAAVQAVVQSIAYSSGGEDPGTRARLIEIDVTDGSGITADLNTVVHMGEILGGFANGIYVVGNSATQIVEAANGGFDTVLALTDYVLPTNVEVMTYIGEGSAKLRGNSQNNQISGGSGHDIIDLRDGGNDVAFGGDGNDGFYFGGAYTSADTIDGGAGSLDQVGLQGDYSRGVALGALTGIEMLVLLSGVDNRFAGATGTELSYHLIASDATLAAGQNLIVQANTLRAGENFTFNGAAELDGSFVIYGGYGNDNLTGGAGNDGFFFGQGRFGAGDVVNGGAGTMDQVGFQGRYTGANSLVFGANQLIGIEYIVLLSASDTRFGSAGGVADYSLVMHDGNVAAGQRMIISANTLKADERLFLFGTPETDGSFVVYSGAGDDTLRGGSLSDQLWGGAGDDIIQGMGGADILVGGAGNDQFRYAFATDSTASARDRITDFATGDSIHLIELASNNGLAGFQFIGGAAQSGAGQVQVVQSGNQATVNIYLNGDATADLVINVTVADGHALTAADFMGIVTAQEPLKPAGVHADDAFAWKPEFVSYPDFEMGLTRDLIIG